MLEDGDSLEGLFEVGLPAGLEVAEGGDPGLGLLEFLVDLDELLVVLFEDLLSVVEFLGVLLGGDVPLDDLDAEHVDLLGLVGNAGLEGAPGLVPLAGPEHVEEGVVLEVLVGDLEGLLELLDPGRLGLHDLLVLDDVLLHFVVVVLQPLQPEAVFVELLLEEGGLVLGLVQLVDLLLQVPHYFVHLLLLLLQTVSQLLELLVLPDLEPKVPHLQLQLFVAGHAGLALGGEVPFFCDDQAVLLLDPEHGDPLLLEGGLQLAYLGL